MKKIINLFLLLFPLFSYCQIGLLGNNTNDAYPSQTSLLVKTRSAWFNKDNSSNNLSVTVNGDIRPSTKNPFTGYDGSSYFDGSSDFLTFTNQTFTGSFTLECWYYQTGNPTNYSILFGGPNVGTSAGNNQFYVNNTGGIAWVDNATVKIAATGTANKNQWNHIAFVRSGTTTYIFLNGSQIATVTNSASIQVDRIGDVNGVGGGYSPLGYLANVRISNIARYTGSFTPSTIPFVNDANTILLTCQVPYTQNNNTFLDHSANDYTITRNGNPNQGSFSPFFGGGSLYCDGTADAISSNIINLNTLNTFTFECWINTVTNSSSSFGGAVMCLGTSGSAYYQLLVRDNTVFVNAPNASSGTYTQSITNGVWHHLAWVNNAGSNAIYWDGTRIGTWTQNYNGVANNSTLYIGSNLNLATNGIQGNISNFRASNNARYSGTTLTVPTGTFQNDANTLFLAKFENAAIYDGARKNNIETAGNIINSSGQTRFNLPTINTDGSGSYAQMPMTSFFDFGSNPFTIDGWFYLSALPSAYKRIMGGINATNATNSTFIVEIDNTNKLVAGFEHSGGYATITHATVLTTGWHYFVLSRNGTTLSLSLDGTNQTATVSANAVLYSSSNTVFIGRFYTSGTTRDFLGNTFDLRVTKNAIRQTSILLKPNSEN